MQTTTRIGRRTLLTRTGLVCRALFMARCACEIEDEIDLIRGRKPAAELLGLIKYVDEHERTAVALMTTDAPIVARRGQRLGDLLHGAD